MLYVPLYLFSLLLLLEFLFAEQKKVWECTLCTNAYWSAAHSSLYVLSMLHSDSQMPVFFWHKKEEVWKRQWLFTHFVQYCRKCTCNAHSFWRKNDFKLIPFLHNIHQFTWRTGGELALPADFDCLAMLIAHWVTENTADSARFFSFLPFWGIFSSSWIDESVSVKCRAWGKGSTAGVESSRGRICPT